MRARPSAEMLKAQSEAEARWRREVARLPFEAKIRQVIELQHRLYPILSATRSLKWWQRPWRTES